MLAVVCGSLTNLSNSLTLRNTEDEEIKNALTLKDNLDLLILFVDCIQREIHEILQIVFSKYS